MLKTLLNLFFDSKALANNPPVFSDSLLGHLGANVDTRPQEQKDKDIPFGEIVASAAIVSWTRKTVFRVFPVFDQATGSDCVANTAAKILGILRWLKDGIFVKFSPAHVYRRRSNFPGEGMIGNNAFEILADGVTLDSIVPSDGLSEAQLNAIQVPPYGLEVARLFKIDDSVPILPPVGDIETIASIIQKTGKPVMVWFYFTSREWGVQNGNAAGYNRPLILDTLSGPQDARALRHSVTAVDFTLTDDGKKALVIEDSAHFGGFSKRIIDETFFSARNWYSAYPMALKAVQVVEPGQIPQDSDRPRYTFTKPLSFVVWDNTRNRPGDTTLHNAQNEDVKALQDILRYEGYLASNIASTGYYGPLTCLAVMKWQIAHNVESVQVLQDLAGERFGAKSISIANSIYGL